MKFFKKNYFASFLTIFSIILLSLGIVLGTLTIQNSKQTQPRAEGPPFVGCVGGGEWLCMCQTASGEWWHECSIIEDSAGKQTYIDKCGGDQQKAFLQWKWDIAKSQSGTGNPACCGGQNVCGSLIPDRPTASPQPTSQPQPTEAVVPTSTSQPTSTPPNNSFPTQAQVFPTTETFFPTSTSNQSIILSFSLPKFNLPQFQIPILQLPNFAPAINNIVDIPLGFLESIFYRIKYYDSNLENYINNKISNVLNSTINK